MSVVGGDPGVDPSSNTVDDRTGSGPGTFKTTAPLQCDSFLQKEATKVDVLWVIDDTGSMGPKQQTVKENFAKFMDRIEHPLGGGTVPDYHIGVVTTDTFDALKSGRLQNKAKLSKPWIGQDTCGQGCNPVDMFKLNADVGLRGSRGEPKGLLAASLALTPPLSNGFNAGFLREDAKLVIVIVSDAEDTSCAPVRQVPFGFGCEGSVLEYGKVDYFVRLIRGLKGEARENDVKLFAFVGTTKDVTVPETNNQIQGCLVSGGSASDPFQYAWFAQRYVEVSTAVTGPDGPKSVCSADFEKIISDFGTTLQTAFFLTRSPVPKTTQCTVTKDSVSTPVQPDSFTVDPARGAVDFRPASAPPAGAVVKCCYSVR
jgi:hypothetical protein